MITVFWSPEKNCSRIQFYVFNEKYNADRKQQKSCQDIALVQHPNNDASARFYFLTVKVIPIEKKNRK